MNIPMDRFGIQSPVIIEAIAEIVLADLFHCQDAVFPRFYGNICQIIVPRPLRSGAGAFDLDRDRGADREVLRFALNDRGVVQGGGTKFAANPIYVNSDGAPGPQTFH